MKKFLLSALLIINLYVSAQHEHHSTDTAGMAQSVHVQMDSIHDPVNRFVLSHSFSLQLPMNRNGSGTAWVPDETPMYGYMLHQKKWMYMFHGNVFIRYTNQDVFKKGHRGGDKFDAVSWFMMMGQRRVGEKGLFHFSTMFSLDNLFGGEGYPLLFQTGETWKGQPLVDRQHPHDLFSELSISYSYAINKNTDVFLYAGYPGEPALGSVAFMHRVSSISGPDAPLTHHWNDGTHITFGVLTGGIRFGKFKLDASSFTGKEPDENRNNFDKPTFDSYSGRLSCNPNKNWAFQVSQGFIKNQEEKHSLKNISRSTASAMYSKVLQKDNVITATILWGMNQSHASEHAALLETAYIRKRFSLYMRYEIVQKSIHELNLDERIFDENVLFPIQVINLGFNLNILQNSAGGIAMGAQGGYYSANERLADLYGKHPVSAQIFIRFFPPILR